MFLGIDSNLSDIAKTKTVKFAEIVYYYLQCSRREAKQKLIRICLERERLTFDVTYSIRVLGLRNATKAATVAWLPIQRTQ